MLYKNHSITVGSSCIDCVSFGRGSKPMVILPGLSIQEVGSAGLSLALMYRSFGKEHRVYVFDKPRQVPPDCSIASIADATAAAMKELGIKMANVLGVSMGGMLAQELAINHPELVGKLVLALTASRPNPTMKKAIESWLWLIDRGAYPAFTRDMFERMYSPAYLERYDPLMPILSRLSKPKDEVRFCRLGRACLTVDSYSRLEEIRCPSLVIGAAEDKVVSAAASRELAESIGCSLHMYANLGHAAYEEAKDFNKIVLDFFEG